VRVSRVYSSSKSGSVDQSGRRIPKLTSVVCTPAGPGQRAVPIDVEGMWPYWLDEAGRAPATVHNDLDAMGSMYLLTGA
jgi:hypothetical protein